LTGSFIKKIGKVGLRRAHFLPDLNQSSFVQLELVAVLDFVDRPPVMITDVVPLFVIYHDALVEGMVLEIAILPPFGLAAQVVCV
jgi:hypothetical protein